LPYRINYTPEAEKHLKALTAAQRALVLEAVDVQLRHQPQVETRNRKPLRPNILARWELRVRNLRVYYVVEEEPAPLVCIRAVGIKKGNQVWIGGEEADVQ
jgi:mRNA-degrading endonuclease RelE of RelBE toxin-antitoxin system